MPTRILSSPWCRCQDTAKYLGLGPYEVHEGLSSFYDGHVDRDETMAALRAELATIGEDELVLFVTQVVISALTGIFVKSGGYLIEDSTRFNLGLKGVAHGFGEEGSLLGDVPIKAI